MSIFDLKFEEISTLHDRESFDCEVELLNLYLKKFARQNHEKGISLTIVATSKKDPKTIIGFYSVSSGQIEYDSLPEEVSKRLPKYPVPIMRIGRLAVDKHFKGKGRGEDLLVNAFERALEVSRRVGIFAVVVDAKNNKAKSFYKKYGFVELVGKPLVLFIPITSIIDALS